MQRLRVLRLVTFAALLAVAGPLAAQGRSRVEIGGFHHRVSDGFGHWSGTTVRLTIAGSGSTWYLDGRAQRAFEDEGIYGGLTGVVDLGSRVFVSGGVGGGSGGFVLPDLRADAALHLKLGAARRVVVYAGATWVDAKRGFEDRAAALGLTWYASARAVLEAGGRLNWSDPGDVRSERALASATLGTPGRRLVVLRANVGREGYQLTGVAATLRRFESQEADVSWQEPLGRRWGIAVGATWYHNPFYTRAGASLGFFHAW